MNIFLFGLEGMKLCTLQFTLEKSINPILEHLQKCSDFDLYNFADDMEKGRHKEWETIKHRINDILIPLKKKMAILKNNQLGHINDFKQFKKEMVLMQENIENLKYDNRQKIKYLDEEIDDLMYDIHFYSEHLLEWERPVRIDSHNVMLQKPKGITTKHRCKEVREFLNFVHLTGGHENGWRQEDHNLFLKFRKKYKVIDIIAKVLNEELPDISIEEIKHHEEWYRKYINLEVKKRNALQNWQREKANKNSATKYSNVPSRIVTTVCTSSNNQEKLKKWKAEKEEQVKIIKQMEKCNFQKKNELEELRKKRNEELKTIVQEWKQKKQTMEQQEVIYNKTVVEEEKKRRALQANKMIKQFQSQDDMYILKMKQRKKSEPAFHMKRSKSSHSAKRDPKRLLKPTQQWMNRVHDDNHSDNFGKIMPLKSLPKLGIPEWRKKME